MDIAIAVVGSVVAICITVLIQHFRPQRKLENEIALETENEVLEAKVEQLKEQIEFYKVKLKNAVDAQDVAERRQLDVFKTFTEMMNGKSELAGYKAAMQDLSKQESTK